MAALYVREHGSRIGVADGRVQVRRKGRVVQEIPVLQVDRIILMVPAYITSQAVRFFMDRGVDIAYLSQNGKFYGQFTRGDGSYVKLRLAQFEKYHDAAFRLALAGRFVYGKVSNILEFWKRQKKRQQAQRGLDQIRRIRDRLTEAASLDALRGHEGAVAAVHFRLFREALQGDWKFKHRIHHPPPDPVNAMLSLGYTLLYSRMSSLLQMYGLDPYLGFFHEIKRGHAALASDMIEEWRCPAVDNLVLRLVNTRQITPAGFHKGGRGKCTMAPAALQRFAEAFEKRLERFNTFRHPGQTDPVSGMPGQVRQLSRVLLGSQKKYAPFAA